MTKNEAKLPRNRPRLHREIEVQVKKIMKPKEKR